MSHDLYENWILSDTPLTGDQKIELKNHLQNCPHCQELADGWQASRRQMRISGLASPAPGFTQRWQLDLAARRLQKQKATARWVLLILVISVVVTFLMLTIFLSNTTTLTDWWLQMTFSFERTFTWLHRLGALLSNWLSGFPSILPPLMTLLVISSAFSILAILWVSAAKQLSAQGAIE